MICILILFPPLLLPFDRMFTIYNTISSLLYRIFIRHILLPLSFHLFRVTNSSLSPYNSLWPFFRSDYLFCCFPINCLPPGSRDFFYIYVSIGDSIFIFEKIFWYLFYHFLCLEYLCPLYCFILFYNTNYGLYSEYRYLHLSKLSG